MKPLPQAFSTSLLLGVAFTMLTWSVYRVSFSRSCSQVWPIWLGQVFVLAVLLAVGESIALALVCGLFVVPCLRLSRHADSDQDIACSLRDSGPWWLASMLGAALTVRL